METHGGTIIMYLKLKTQDVNCDNCKSEFPCLESLKEPPFEVHDVSVWYAHDKARQHKTRFTLPVRNIPQHENSGIYIESRRKQHKTPFAR